MFEEFEWRTNDGLEQLPFLHVQPLKIMTLLPSKVIPEESFLRQKYLVEGLSSGEIAVQLTSSRPTITAYLKKYKIPLKRITRRQDGKRTYGHRFYGQKAIPVSKEHKTIAWMIDQRCGGKSYQKIAESLNDQKVPTKNKLGPWYGKVVKQIIKRNLLSKGISDCILIKSQQDL